MANEIATLKQFGENPAIKRRFDEVLKERAPQFMASVINAVGNNFSLQKCDPNSIWGSAMVAAALNLPIDSNLGFAAIVPYGQKAQFQIMWKGFVQLAIRSGQYKNLGAAVVYNDEIESYDPITDTVVFTPVSGRTQRENGDDSNVFGYYAFFELNSGFRKHILMTKKQVENHAKKYSQAFNSNRDSQWKSNFDAMGKKTVIKLLLSRFGILSVEMQKAIVSDQAAIDEKGEIIDHVDNKPEIQTPKIEAPKVEKAQQVIIEEDF